MSEAGLLVLFADEIAAEEAPGLDTVKDSYFTLGTSNGVFSVEEGVGEVKAWSAEVQDFGRRGRPIAGLG